MKNLILICGIPNSGKTTYSSNFENVIHLDDYINNPRTVFDCFYLCSQEAADTINTVDNVCIEGVFNTKKQRERLLTTLKLKGVECKKTCIWVNTPSDICLERSSVEGCKSESVVKVHIRRFEIPTKEEGWDEIIEIKNK